MDKRDKNDKQTQVIRHKTRPRSLWRGVVAGLAAGLVASAAKTYFNRIHIARISDAEGEDLPAPLVLDPMPLAGHLARHTIAEPERTLTAESIPWAMGAVTGAAYGAAAEFFPQATAQNGARFGLFMGSISEGRLLPVVDLDGPCNDPRPEQRVEQQEAHKVAGYMVFGLVAETVRSLIRRFW